MNEKPNQEAQEREKIASRCFRGTRNERKCFIIDIRGFSSI